MNTFRIVPFVLLLLTLAAACRKESGIPPGGRQGMKKLKSMRFGEVGQSNRLNRYYYENDRLIRLVSIDSVYITYNTPGWYIDSVAEEYKYDDAGRLSNILYPDPYYEVVLEYDAQGRLARKIRPLLKDTIHFDYANGRVVGRFVHSPNYNPRYYYFYFSNDLDSVMLRGSAGGSMLWVVQYSYSTNPDLSSLAFQKSFNMLMKADYSVTNFEFQTYDFQSMHWFNLYECTRIKIKNSYNPAMAPVSNTGIDRRDLRGYPLKGHIDGRATYYEYYEVNDRIPAPGRNQPFVLKNLLTAQ